MVQLEGRTVRRPIEPFQSEFKNSEHVRNLFVRYSETLPSQGQQTVACNIVHRTEERTSGPSNVRRSRSASIPLPHLRQRRKIVLLPKSRGCSK
jgi:hypothetical protein